MTLGFFFHSDAMLYMLAALFLYIIEWEETELQKKIQLIDI